MVKARVVKFVVSPGQLTIRIEKRWIACHSQVQQIDCPHEIRHPTSCCYCRKIIVGTRSARIELESDEIAGRSPLNRQFLSSRDLGAKLVSDFLRNLALD